MTLFPPPLPPPSGIVTVTAETHDVMKIQWPPVWLLRASRKVIIPRRETSARKRKHMLLEKRRKKTGKRTGYKEGEWEIKRALGFSLVGNEPEEQIEFLASSHREFYTSKLHLCPVSYISSVLRGADATNRIDI